MMERVLPFTSAFFFLLVTLLSVESISHSVKNRSKLNATSKHPGDPTVIQPLVVSEQVIFESGEANVLIYRIPLLTYTPGGHLLAIVEGRKKSGDQDLKFITTRRSTDGGLKWETEAFIHNDGTREDNLGVVLVDDITEEIYIFYGVCGRTASCDPGSVPTVMYAKSTDDGVTWKPPVNVTAQAGARNFAPGPGPGLQTIRLVVFVFATCFLCMRKGPNILDRGDRTFQAAVPRLQNDLPLSDSLRSMLVVTGQLIDNYNSVGEVRVTVEQYHSAAPHLDQLTFTGQRVPRCDANRKKFAPFKGRLIVCGHGGELVFNGVFCLLSDDHGVTWRWGAQVLPIPAYTNNKAGDFVPDECQPMELPDGSVMLNVRNQYHYHCNCRIVMMSYDGMETINTETIHLDKTLIEPAVSSAIFTHMGVVFFSNPASETSRINMTLRWSFDNGTTWSGALPIWEGPSGYSVMTAFPGSLGGLTKEKYIYLAYEKGRVSPTETVSFVTISLDGTL